MPSSFGMMHSADCTCNCPQCEEVPFVIELQTNVPIECHFAIASADQVPCEEPGTGIYEAVLWASGDYDGEVTFTRDSPGFSFSQTFQYVEPVGDNCNSYIRTGIEINGIHYDVTNQQFLEDNCGQCIGANQFTVMFTRRRFREGSEPDPADVTMSFPGSGTPVCDNCDEPHQTNLLTVRDGWVTAGRYDVSTPCNGRFTWQEWIPCGCEGGGGEDPDWEFMGVQNAWIAQSYRIAGGNENFKSWDWQTPDTPITDTVQAQGRTAEVLTNSCNRYTPPNTDCACHECVEIQPNGI